MMHDSKSMASLEDHNSGSQPRGLTDKVHAERRHQPAIMHPIKLAHDGVHKLTQTTVATCLSPRVRLVRKFLTLLLCLGCILAQLALLDYYFIAYTESAICYVWILADLLVIASFLWMLAVQGRNVARCFKDPTLEPEEKTEHAWFAWIVYALVICAKVVVANYTFSATLTFTAHFGLNGFRMVTAASTVAFLLLVLGHYYTGLETPRRLYLSFLACSVTIDILDSVQFMDYLYVALTPTPFPLALRIAVQFFACVNFVLPTFALLKLRFPDLPHLRFLPYDRMYMMAYLMLSNLPYLVIRVYLWGNGGTDSTVQVFIVKNVIGFICSIREVWLAYLLYKEHKQRMLLKHEAA